MWSVKNDLHHVMGLWIEKQNISANDLSKEYPFGVLQTLIPSLLASTASIKDLGILTVMFA